MARSLGIARPSGRRNRSLTFTDVELMIVIKRRLFVKCRSYFVSGGWIARRFQLDVVKFQCSRLSMRFLGCPAAMASRVALR